MSKVVAFCLSSALLALSICSPAAQQLSPDWTQCVNQGNKFSPDIQISGCSAVLLADGETEANRAVALNNRGVAYRAKRDYDRAVADHTEAIRLNPSYAIAYDNRGGAYLHKGDYDRAIADHTEAIKLSPSDDVAYYNRGLAHFRKSDYARAVADFSEAIKLSPNDAWAYNNRGHAYEALRRREEAVADFRRALSIDPNLQFSRDALKRLGAGP